MASVLIKNASQILQVCAKKEKFLAGEAAGKLAQLDKQGNEGLSLVVKRYVIRLTKGMSSYGFTWCGFCN